MNKFYRQHTCLHDTSASQKWFSFSSVKGAFNRQIVHFSLVFGVLSPLPLILYLSTLLVNFHAWQVEYKNKVMSLIRNPFLTINAIKLIEVYPGKKTGIFILP